MSGIICSTIKTLSATHEILPEGRSLWGILEQCEDVGGGLIRISVSGREYLVDESLQERLSGLVGQHMTVCRLFGQWGCGGMPA